MKKDILNYLILLLFLPVLFTACKKKDDNTPSSSIQSTLQQGNWKITLYNDDGNIETNHYTGYSFTFNSNNSISASNGSNSASGTWSTGTDDSQLKLYLDFGTLIPFDELNDDWHILQQNSSLIRLEDVSGGNGGTDVLTFEKI